MIGVVFCDWRSYKNIVRLICITIVSELQLLWVHLEVKQIHDTGFTYHYGDHLSMNTETHFVLTRSHSRTFRISKYYSWLSHLYWAIHHQLTYWGSPLLECSRGPHHKGYNGVKDEICDWLWENPPLTQKDKYLEIHM